MPYLHVKDFKIGMDRRRPKSSGVPGALWVGKNVHITRGGDIESAKKFVPTFTLPAGTFGMGTSGGQIFVFGSADIGSTMPAGVQYQRLTVDSGAAMVRVLDVKPSSRKLYVIAEFDDGTVYHFYNGARVTDWDGISDANADFATLADYLADKINSESAVEASAFGSTILVTSRVPGVAFSLSTAAVDGGAANDQNILVATLQAARAAAAEIQASATVTITGGSADPGINQIRDITVNGVSLMQVPVNWHLTHAHAASEIAAEISRLEPIHGYAAVSVGNVVTVSAASGTGAAPNGYLVDVVTRGDITFTSTNMAGGTAALAALPQITSAIISGTMEVADKFTVTVNGTSYSATPRGAAAGTAIQAHNKRMFSPAASLLRFCKINDPANWTDAAASSGAGFISVSSDSEGYERVVGSAPFNTLTAVFGRRIINLYTLGTDAALFALDRPIENTGARAARSIKPYGNNEVFYLDDTGVRSLRARYGSDTPYASDVGSPIDPFVQEHINTIALDKVARAVAEIEPIDGRFWLAMGERIYVLSFFPSNKIEAWTYYEPGFEITDMVRIKSHIYVRAANTIYLYGGADGQTWPEDDETESLVETPFVWADRSATLKNMAGADFDLLNQWEVKMYPDPNRPDQFDTIGQVSKITGGQPHIKIPGNQACWSLSFRCVKGGKATISQHSIHYNLTEDR